MTKHAKGNQREKLLTKGFILSFLSRFGSNIVFTLLNVTLVYYCMARFGVDAAGAGLAVGVFIVASLFARIASVKLSDLAGRRRILIGSHVLFLISTCAYLLPLNYYGLVLIRIVNGAAFGASSNALAAISLDYIPKSRFGEGVGILALAVTLSTVIGPFVGIELLHSQLFTSLFAICVTLSAVACVAVFFLDVEEIDAKADGHHGELNYELRSISAEKNAFSQLFEIKVIPLSLVVIFLSTGYSFVTAFLDSYASSMGQAELSSCFFVVFGFCMTATRPLMGRLLDKTSDSAIVYPSLACYALAFALTALRFDFLTVVCIGLLLSIGYGGLFSCLQAIAMKPIPAGRSNAAMSTFYVFTDCALGFGPTIGGFLITIGGYACIYFMGVLFAVIAGIIYFLLWGRNKGRRESEGSEHPKSSLSS